MGYLNKLLEEWTHYQPINGKSCCGVSHFEVVNDGNLIPLLDQSVCPRELAWRRYVRFRDGNTLFPFKIERTHKDAW